MTSMAVFVAASAPKVKTLAKQSGYSLAREPLPFSELLTFWAQPPIVDPEINVGGNGWVALGISAENPVSPG